MEKFTVSAESFKSHMNVPPELMKPYQVAVSAGLKLLFSEQTAKTTLEYMDEPGELKTKMANGIVGIVGVIYQKSNGTMPGQIIIPVGVELIAHCVEVARKSGIELSDEDVADGVAEYIKVVLQQSGATPEQMQQALGGMDSGQNSPEV